MNVAGSIAVDLSARRQRIEVAADGRRRVGLLVWPGSRSANRPGITAASPLDLYYMPYTHSLLRRCCGRRGGSSAAGRFDGRLGRVVRGWAPPCSHWILDLLVHRPDLPLYDNTAKVGLGLWNYLGISLALEALVLGGRPVAVPEPHEGAHVGWDASVGWCSWC